MTTSISDFWRVPFRRQLKTMIGMNKTARILDANTICSDITAYELVQLLKLEIMVSHGAFEPMTSEQKALVLRNSRAV